MIHAFVRRLAALTLAAAAAGCATPEPQPGELIADPFERTNREFHEFNVGVDLVLVRPATYIYDQVTPALFQHMISNFVDHIRLPVIAINNVLQGDLDEALDTVGRFGVNTLMGAGGLLDPATELDLGLEYRNDDFGLTLAAWGVEEGPFLVAPFFGPLTQRDSIGLAGNIAINPLTYVTFGGGDAQALATAGQVVAPIIVARDENFALVDQLFYESEDSYVATRTAYILNRRARVNDGDVAPETLPDIFDVDDSGSETP